MDISHENIQGKSIKWPLPGTSANDLSNTDYRIMLASDIFSEAGFRLFYQSWARNINLDGKRPLYIPSVEIQETTLPSVYTGDISITTNA